jgi:hypothetical protein
MGAGETGPGDKAAIGRATMWAAGAIALVCLLVLGARASTANADPLAMAFTEARANVGVQLSDAALFEAPKTAPFAGQIDPGSGSITAGHLQVPQFSTHITDPLNADVTVDFDIGVISGSFDRTTGALTLKGTAGGTLTSEEKECVVSTTPSVLVLSTTGNSGGASPRSGAPFAVGLTGPGAIAGQWTDMSAEPAIPGEGVAVCNTVDERIEGPGGIWLEQKGDRVAPAAPQLTSTDPASPASSGAPRILGTAEAGSTVRLYASPSCTGIPVATGSAAKLVSPGFTVEVGVGVTVAFSATATDAAGNASACSVPISYTRTACVVPKLKGKSLRRARLALRAANCSVSEVRRPKRKKGKRGPLVVKSSKPSAGKTLEAGGEVDLRLGRKPHKGRH